MKSGFNLFLLINSFFSVIARFYEDWCYFTNNGASRGLKYSSRRWSLSHSHNTELFFSGQTVLLTNFCLLYFHNSFTNTRFTRYCDNKTNSFKLCSAWKYFHWYIFKSLCPKTFTFIHNSKGGTAIQFTPGPARKKMPPNEMNI